MDRESFHDYTFFRDLSLKPLSYDSLSYAFAAFSVLQLRYPEMPIKKGILYPSMNNLTFEKPEIGTIPDAWQQYAEVGEYVNPTAWGSILVENTPIDVLIIDSYLSLVGENHRRISLLKYHDVKDGTYSISDQGKNQPTIIPLQILTTGETSWAFIVAYDDCIHYYHTQENYPMLNITDKHSREVKPKWMGPKGQDDSSVYMLLGISRIINGKPHISEQAATGEVLHNFRIRIMVELHCGQLDPSEEDFQRHMRELSSGSQNILSTEGMIPPLLIDSPGAQNTTAPNGTSLGTLADSSADIPLTGQVSASNDPPEIFYVSSAQITPVTSSKSHVSPVFSVNSSATQNTSATSSRSRLSSQSASNITNNVKHFNTMRGILNLLSKASLACRLSKSSEKTSLAILWHLVKEDRLGSIFHQRYNAVLFYKRMEEMQSEEAIITELKVGGEDIRLMKKRKKECKFWNDICKIGEDFGWKDDKKYVMLLAISSLPTNASQKRKKEVIKELRRYLEDTSESLKEWLLSAQQLCTMIVKQSLPNENLMIDLYHLKKGQEINETTYKLFVSIDAHEAAEIDRIYPVN